MKVTLKLTEEVPFVKIAQVHKEGNRKEAPDPLCYNLDTILSIANPRIKN